MEKPVIETYLEAYRRGLRRAAGYDDLPPAPAQRDACRGWAAAAAYLEEVKRAAACREAGITPYR